MHLKSLHNLPIEGPWMTMLAPSIVIAEDVCVLACLGESWVLAAARVRDGVLAASKAALERMEACRKVFLRGRALALAQRMALYARDELNMSTLRIRVCPRPSECWTTLRQSND